MSSTTTAPAAPKESLLAKFWNFIKNEISHVEAGIEAIFGSDVAQKIEAAGKALLESQFGPLIPAAIADATDVATGQMSVSKAITSLIAMAEAEGKSLTQAAALQIIGVAQNSLPAAKGPGGTVTPVA
jgi:hypothetical protein